MKTKPEVISRTPGVNEFSFWLGIPLMVEVHLTSGNSNLLIKDFGELEPARKLQLLISQKTGLTYNDKAIRE